MDKEFKVLIIEAARYKVMLEYAIKGLQGKTACKGLDLAEFLEKRMMSIEEEIQEIKQQS